MENDDSDAAAILQQMGAGTRMPLEETTAANRPASQQEPAAAPARLTQATAQRAIVCTPPRSGPAHAPRSPGGPSDPMAGFTPPDKLTLMRPFAAQMPEHMNNERLGSRYVLAPPVDITRLPPRPPAPAAPMPIAPCNAETAGLFAMYHMSRAGLAQQGIHMPVSSTLLLLELHADCWPNH